ncbi:hypothetical protein AAG570_000293 [Ranatra chinensis]|uniref:Uncharacterized protein n=1 Tax=Ranatra chinensis TaxID=642074 RepID=A0ABD0YXB2_9HEMI
MFSFKAKTFFAKKKSCIRIENGSWSEKFSLDVAGSSGIGVNIQLTYNTLTKQVMFTPYHVLINNCPLAIECKEVSVYDNTWIKVSNYYVYFSLNCFARCFIKEIFLLNFFKIINEFHCCNMSHPFLCMQLEYISLEYFFMIKRMIGSFFFRAAMISSRIQFNVSEYKNPIKLACK